MVTFHTDPIDALVSDQFGDLGSARDPVPLRNSYAKGDVALCFRAPGYRDFKVEVSSAYFNTAHLYPPEGVLRLQPSSLAAYLHYYRLPLLAGGLPLLSAAGLLLLSRRKVKHAAELHARVSAPAQSGARNELSGRVDRYNLVERLGSGAAATVYRAIEVENPQGEEVAIKVLHENTSSNRNFRQRFKREAQLYQQLSHPNIVKMLGWGEQSGLIYLVLELIDGGTLRERLHPQGLPPATAIGYLDPLFRAIDYAHRQGVVHRDLKPENIMVTREEVLKVADFGLGRADNSESLTASDTTLGTPAYMAPEQIVDGSHATSVDQYALGILSFELLCGRRPFVADEPVKIIFMQVSDAPPSPRALRPDLPPSVEEVLLRLLAKSPQARFETVELARQALMGALQSWAAPL
jgi:tRNA A-37 threonylcarbamoyl transferase component Bud32